MPEIWFTQYMLPNGCRVPISIDRPQQVYEKASKITAAGFVLEAEVLTNGMVSLTIGHPGYDIDVSIKVCQNGSLVPTTVDTLIMEFDLDNWVERINALESWEPCRPTAK